MLNKERTKNRSSKKKTLSLRFCNGHTGYSFNLSPWWSLCLIALISMGVVRYNDHQDAKFQALESQIDKLNEKNLQLESYLSFQEKEKEQLAVLAETRSEDLWKKIEKRDREIEELWGKLGEERPQVSVDRKGQRRSLQGSRAGQRDALRVKRRYAKLLKTLDGNDPEMEKLVAATDARVAEIEREREAKLMSVTPSLRPCAGALTSPFGNRIHPIYGYQRFHAGQDIGARHGEPIYAAAAGVVTTSTYLSGYGNTIELDHGGGMETLYAHCSSLAVGTGTYVKKGDLIAYVGNTGASTGPHLHYEIRINGNPVDPAPYMTQSRSEALCSH